MWNRKFHGAIQILHTRPRLFKSPFAFFASFSTSQLCRSYEDTISNVVVTPDTTVVVQGFTGKQATFDSKQTLEYGTKIIGGVRPGKEGEHLGLPYLPSMQAVKKQLNPHATLVYVAAPHAAGAIEEAVEAEIPLIVAVAEHIPIHDMLRVQSILRAQSKSRLVGANSPGMTSTHAKCRLGFQPIPFFKQGIISIVAKSGTLSYETVASTTKAGLGQSYVIGMGGDTLPGTDFVDALKVFEHDKNTEGIILVGEVGGFAEERAADWIQDYRRRTPEPKPIMALIAGLQAVPGRVMGHDGAVSAPGEGSARSKIHALEAAGVVMTDHPSKFGEAMKGLLRPGTRLTNSTVASQKRTIHALLRRQTGATRRETMRSQRRSLTLSQSQSLSVLKDLGFPTATSSSFPSECFVLTLSVDRSFNLPKIHIQRTRSAATIRPPCIRSIGILYQRDGSYEIFHKTLAPVLQVVSRDQQTREDLEQLLYGLALLWRKKEGEWFQVVCGGTEGGKLAVTSADLRFDDWAFRMAGRHEDLHRLRDVTREVTEEVEAEADSIVYIRLPGDGKVGTLVNGAGLAMNTTDALALAGHPAANFLDTGGKATSATVRASLRAVTSDPRVTAVLVNIFGGLTRCDMIAEGIVGAVKEEGIKVPLVVRLRGTREAEGAEVLRAEGGEGVLVEQDFETAVRRVGALAAGTQGGSRERAG